MAIETIRRFKRPPFYQRGGIVSVEPASPGSTETIPPEPVEETSHAVRLFVSSPAYAEAERQQVDGVLARLNAAFSGKVRIEAIGQDMPGSFGPGMPAFGAADCDAVIAIMRPRLATNALTSSDPVSSEARGGVAGVLSAVQGREPDAGLPDIYIFRYAEADATDRAESDADWEARRQVFEGWFKAKGGKFLAFADFSLPDEFGARLEGQLRPWLAGRGFVVPPSESAISVARPDETQALEGEIVAAPTEDSASEDSAPADAPEQAAASIAQDKAARGEGKATTEPLVTGDGAPEPAIAAAEPSDTESSVAEIVGEPTEAGLTEESIPTDLAGLNAPEQLADPAASSYEGRPQANGKAWARAGKADRKHRLRPKNDRIATTTADPASELEGTFSTEIEGLPAPAGAAAPRSEHDREDAEPTDRLAPNEPLAFGAIDAVAEAAPVAQEDKAPSEIADVAVEPDPARSGGAANAAALARAFEEARQQRAEWDEKYRALEAKAKDAVAVALRLEREDQAHAREAQAKSRRLARATVIGLIVVLVALLAVIGAQWRSAAAGRDGAEQNLAVAADGASTLLFDLTQASRRRSGATDAADKKILELARTLSGQLANAREFNPNERRDLADSAMSAADSLFKQSKVADALKAAAQAQQILHTLTAAYPDQPEWQSRLALSDAKTGEMFVAQHNSDAALDAFRDAMAIRHALALKEPTNTERQRALSSSQQQVGDVLVVKGRLDEALAVYREAQGVRKAITLNDPENPDSQRDLMEIDNAIGDLLTTQNHLDEALVIYQESLEIAERMAPKNPVDLKWSRALTFVDNKIGDVLLAKERIEDALAAYREGLTIIKGLAAREPGNSEWQSLVATSQERIGDALSAEAHHESALAAYREALTIVMTLGAQEPANVEWQRGISETHLRIGWVLFNQGKIDAAIAAHRESLVVVRALIVKEPDTTRWQRDLMLDDGKIAQLLMAQGKHTEALLIYSEALSVAKEMGSKDPDNPEWQSTRAVIDSNVGRLLMEAGKRDNALLAYRDARIVAEALAAKEPRNVDWQTGLVISYYNLAEAGEETSTNLLRAIDILKRLEAAGVLPADKKLLIGKIDEELESYPSQSKRR
ncbi:MAG: hypothetical protein JWM91_3871 [Rhodospirillales bacterium]|nr:hypothetical protein [Rhodospirillales bacterium]